MNVASVCLPSMGPWGMCSGWTCNLPWASREGSWEVLSKPRPEGGIGEALVKRACGKALGKGNRTQGLLGMAACGTRAEGN